MFLALPIKNGPLAAELKFRENTVSGYVGLIIDFILFSVRVVYNVQQSASDFY